MATRLEIANAAIAELGGEPLAGMPDRDELDDLETFDENAIHAGQTYYTIADKALTEYPWAWLVRREPLTRDAVPGTHFRYRFNLPGRILGGPRAIYRTQHETRPLVEGWTRVGTRQVESDLDALWIEYAEGVDEEGWPPAFVDALIQRLCARWAYYHTDQANLAQHYEQQAERAFLDAKRIDAQSKPSEGFTDFPLMDARFGGTGSRSALLQRAGGGAPHYSPVARDPQRSWADRS